MKNYRLPCVAAAVAALFLANIASASVCSISYEPPRVGKNYCEPQCVSHVESRLGKNWRTARSGDAGDFLNKAGSFGMDRESQGSKDRPKKGGVIVWPRAAWNGQYGHVAYIESVDTKNDRIHISEANYDGKCRCQTRSLTYTKKNGKYSVNDKHVVAGWLNPK